jgi:hypothetical protein
MKPPLLSQALLLTVAGPCEAECIAGDLEEEFAMIRDARGSASARRWYTWQVVRSVCALLQLRIRSGELTQVALIASLGVAAPLLLLDRMWQFIYSQIPLKDGLHRAPEFLAVNALCVCACAGLLGAWAGSKSPAGKLRHAPHTLGFAAASAAMFAVWASVANAPALYVIVIALAVPGSALFTFAWRKSR